MKFLSKPSFLSFLISILFFLIDKLLKKILSIFNLSFVSIFTSLRILIISSLITLVASISISFPLQLMVNCSIVDTFSISKMKSLPST